MNRTYRIQYADYALGENEKQYMDLARKGWRLKKRGIWLSGFEKSEPQELLYRIEVSAPGFLDDAALPEDQIAVYEECGWEFVTRKGLIHVFCAPGDSEIQELYTSPEQQAATLKVLRRQYWMHPLYMAGMILLYAFLGMAVSGWRLEKLGASAYEFWLQQTAAALFLVFFLLFSLLELFYGGLQTGRLYRGLKKGNPLDHRPSGRHLVYRTICVLLGGICGMCALFACMQWIGTEESSMPETADGPYLLLEEMGIDGERSASFYQGRTSSVKTWSSFTASVWDTYECLDVEGTEYWMYNTVYELKRGVSPQRTAEMLMYVGTFADTPEAWSTVEIKNLDTAYASTDGMEYIAVKGNRVWHVVCCPDKSEAKRS